MKASISQLEAQKPFTLRCPNGQFMSALKWGLLRRGVYPAISRDPLNDSPPVPEMASGYFRCWHKAYREF